MIAAAGRMGWKPDEFWFSTPSFFFAALNGHLDQERERQYHAYGRARLIAYYAIIAPDPDRRKHLRLSDIISLPGDEEHDMPQFAEMTQEEIEQFSTLADSAYEQFHGEKWHPSHN